MEHRNAARERPSPLSRFEFAPPRHFLLPTILLLLCERPGYGYSLVKDLSDLGFGRVDRPSVYRALGRLEADGLVESWTGEATAGQPRRVYTLTTHGSDALREWMGVIKEERSALDRVLRRYQATGRGGAVLAEAEGQWAALLGPDWSPVSSSARTAGWPWARSARVEGQPDAATDEGAPGDRRAPDREGAGAPAVTCAGTDEDDSLPVHPPRRFHVVPGRSAVLVEARSTVGPITFGALGLTGEVEASMGAGAICPCQPPSGQVALEVARLRSGNSLYDAELLRRIGARRYPVVAMELRDSCRLGPGLLYRLGGEVTFHGVTRTIQGTAEVEVDDDGRLEVTGEQVIDIRDFDLASPTVLMLRIYPDVRVRLHVEAELVA
jgi:PadR family transcriptional regulator PadR